VDWWFAYTEHSADIVKENGFPEDRITVFNNAIDTTAIAETKRSISREDTNQLRDDMVNGSQNVGIYIGGLYQLKRIPFLLEAAHEIRARIPDFHLIIIGGGVDLELLRAAARENPWIHVLGPKFDHEKALYASLAKVFLMPGLVGLAVLDSFAYGLPMVTTDLSYHSPEIAYLKNGANGVIFPDSDDVVGYADEVTRVLTDKHYRDELVAGASVSAGEYSIENMASRFADGAIAALSRGRRAD
jgi:glycosyltransferase involved in cell wall biosynthesis